MQTQCIKRFDNEELYDAIVNKVPARNCCYIYMSLIALEHAFLVFEPSENAFITVAIWIHHIINSENCDDRVVGVGCPAAEVEGAFFLALVEVRLVLKHNLEKIFESVKYHQEKDNRSSIHR